MARATKENWALIKKLGLAIVETIQQEGGSEDDVQRIVESRDLKLMINALVMGKSKLIHYPTQIYAPHLFGGDRCDRRESHSLNKDVWPRKFDPKKLRFTSVIRDGESRQINGQKMMARAKEMNAEFGLADVPALLGPDGKGLETIPVELRDVSRRIILPEEP